MMTEKKEDFVAELNEAIERHDRILVKLADMVIGLTREQYAQNVLTIEQEPMTADFLRQTNEQLMDHMVGILADKARIEKKVPPGFGEVELAMGLRKSLKRSVDEYLLGLRETTNDG
jgi:hypothetical protein